MPAAAPDTEPQAEPQELAERFYDAFVNRRLDDMEALYAPDVSFRDTVFELAGREATMGMWRAILRDPKNGVFTYRFDRTEGDVAVGHWEADYKLFGRPVHNEIESRLTVRDGLIVEHTDRFSWSRWAKQAFPLGPLVDVPGVRFVLTRAIRRQVAGRRRRR